MEVKVTAPLDILDKTLLQLLQSRLSITTQGNVKDEDIQRAFSNWLWTRKLNINFQHAFIEEGLPHEGIRMDKAATWEAYLSLLNHFSLEFLHFRTDDLKAKNPHLPDAFQPTNLKATGIVPSTEDLSDWKFLAQLLYDNFVGIPNAWQLSSQQILERMRQDWPISSHDTRSKDEGKEKKEAEDDRGISALTVQHREKSVGKFPFSVYSLVHKCSILHRRGGRINDEKVIECLFSDHKLATLYEPLDQDGTLIFRPFKDRDDSLRTLARLSGSFYAVWLVEYGDTGYVSPWILMVLLLCLDF